MQPRVAGTMNQITCQKRFFSPSLLHFQFRSLRRFDIVAPCRREAAGGGRKGVDTTVRTAGGTMCGYRGYKVVVLAPQNSKVNSCGELLSDASLLYKDDGGFLGGPRKCAHTL